MNGHRYNNVTIAARNTGQRILAAIKSHGPSRPESLGKRLGLSATTINDHLGRLRRAGAVTLVRSGRHYTYFIGAENHAPRREPSIAYAGYVTVGRGLAGW